MKTIRYCVTTSVAMLSLSCVLSAAILDQVTGYYKLDASSGQTVVDSSGAARDGFLGDGAATTSKDPTRVTGAAALIGPGALQFTDDKTPTVGRPDMITLGVGDELLPRDPARYRLGPATISAWVNPDLFETDPTYGALATFYNSSAILRLSVGSGSGSTGYAAVQFLDRAPASPQNVTAVGSTALTTGEWHHLAFTYQGSSAGRSLKLYVDGMLDTDFGTAYDLQYPAAVTADSGNAGNYEGLTGRTDDLAFWSRELTARDIAAIHGLGVFAGVGLDDAAFDALLAMDELGDSVAGVGPAGETWRFSDAIRGPAGSAYMGGPFKFIALDGAGNGLTTSLIPEPGAFALLAVALSMLARRRRRA